jgi:putative multiple sugar transport system substrate-binding protein
MSIFVLAAMVLAACQPAATEAPPVETEAAPPEETEAPPEVAAGSVGVVLPTKEEPRWIQDETRFQDAFDAAGVEVEILFSEGDSAKERANVEDLITKGVEVIILTPHDGSAAAAAAEVARDAGVKVVSYDRLILDTEAVDYYVTFDSIAVGEAQGQYLVDKASGSDNPLYLYAGAATDNNAFLFFEGAWNVLQPKIADGTFVIKNSSEAVALQDKAELTRDEMADIIGQVNTEWDFDTAKSLAEANLTVATAEDKGDVFILAPNDGTARSIADTFAADSDVTSYVVTGQDAEIASVQYIIDGKQSMTVLKDVRTLVGDAIAAAVAFLDGSTPPETQTYNNGVFDVPAKPSVVISVDQDNVQAEIIDSGYWPAEEFTAAAPTEEPMAFRVGFVTDTGGIDDQSFNTNQWAGVEKAMEVHGVEGQFIQSDEATQYEPNLTEFASQGYDLVHASGFFLGGALANVAALYPDVNFSIFDYAYPDAFGVPEGVVGNAECIPNVMGSIFKTDQAAFLAGYVAAGMTETGKLGYFGGAPIPTVTIFGVGFQAGMEAYNEAHGTDVTLIGWDNETGEGLFTGDFIDLTKGKESAESLFDEGADIFMGVGGLIGAPGFDVARERGGYGIWVDTDGYVSLPGVQDVILTSVMKVMDEAVFAIIEETMAGDFQGCGVYVGDLANGGVGIAPYHDLDSAVPDELKAEVEALADAILSGEITDTGCVSYPDSCPGGLY